MLRREDVSTHYLQAPPHLNRPEISVTVDFDFEYEKVKRIADVLYSKHGYEFSTEDIISYLDDLSLLVFANGDLGYRCLKYLIERNEDIAGLVLHPPHEAKRRDDILGLIDVDRVNVISPDNLEDAWVKEWVREIGPDLILSFWSSFIFDQNIIDIPPRGIVNIHNSKLPHCRGSAANIWTILENAPGGVTIHYVVPGVDKGPVISQLDVPIRSWDTGRSLFYRLQDAMVRIFKNEWPRVRVGPVKTNEQKGDGSFHYHGEAQKLKKINLEEKLTAREFIDRLRAFSFSPYEGCYFVDNLGNKVYMNLELNRGITTRKNFQGANK
jgi:methionyl-tRNA formyltransferase